jgi:hypothetical protein
MLLTLMRRFLAISTTYKIPSCFLLTLQQQTGQQQQQTGLVFTLLGRLVFMRSSHCLAVLA